MNPTRIDKLLSRFSSGLLTAPEVANALLMDLVLNDDTKLQSFLPALPDEIQEKLLDLLRNIRNADYRWKPFLIGIDDTPYVNPEVLQRICAEMGVT